MAFERAVRTQGIPEIHPRQTFIRQNTEFNSACSLSKPSERRSDETNEKPNIPTRSIRMQRMQTEVFEFSDDEDIKSKNLLNANITPHANHGRKHASHRHIPMEFNELSEEKKQFVSPGHPMQRRNAKLIHQVSMILPVKEISESPELKLHQNSKPTPPLPKDSSRQTLKSQLDLTPEPEVKHLEEIDRVSTPEPAHQVEVEPVIEFESKELENSPPRPKQSPQGRPQKLNLKKRRSSLMPAVVEHHFKVTSNSIKEVAAADKNMPALDNLKSDIKYLPPNPNKQKIFEFKRHEVAPQPLDERTLFDTKLSTAPLGYFTSPTKGYIHLAVRLFDYDNHESIWVNPRTTVGNLIQIIVKGFYEKYSSKQRPDFRLAHPS